MSFSVRHVAVAAFLLLAAALVVLGLAHHVDTAAITPVTDGGIWGTTPDGGIWG